MALRLDSRSNIVFSIQKYLANGEEQSLCIQILKEWIVIRNIIIFIMAFIRQPATECANVARGKKNILHLICISLEDLMQPIDHRYRKKSVTEAFTQI